MSKLKEEFTKNDWDHLHDCWFHVKGTKPSQKELERLFTQLSADLQILARVWGMNDTDFREGVIKWIQSNHFTEE